MAKKKPETSDPYDVEAQGGGVKVNLLNDSGELARVLHLGSLDLPFRITFDGRVFEHVSEDASGTWQYAPR